MTGVLDPAVEAEEPPGLVPDEPEGVEGAATPGDEEEGERSPIRLAIACGLTTAAAGVMVGGIFAGVTPRIYAIVAGALGVALALVARQVRSTVGLYIVITLGLLAIALAMVASVPNDLGSVGGLISKAVGDRSSLRPPVDITGGWKFIIGAVLAFCGFASAWVAIEVKRPPIAILLPLPLAAIAAISVPKSAQVASGIACLALFAISLGIISTATAASDDAEKPPLAYELRRAGRGMVFVLVITVVLVILAQTNVLFPKPIIDPAQEAQKPRTVPPSEVVDRVLFRVKAKFQIQWRLGALDVYDGQDWRLPPFVSSKLEKVPSSGVISTARQNQLRAEFTTIDIEGATLPSLPGVQGIIANGPPLVVDSRAGTVRLNNGQVPPDFTYTMVSPNLPTIDELRGDDGPVSKDMQDFVEIPSPPPAVQALLREARQQDKRSKWDQFDFLRTYVLDEVTATGPGLPVSIPPSRVQAILGGAKKEATPFEIVAIQAMLARWAGVPGRIGFGFDQCDVVENAQECRPKHASIYVEVFFPKFGWLPVVGTPKKAKPTAGSNPSQQKTDPNVLPSDDLAVDLFLPIPVKPPSTFVQNALRVTLGIALAAVLIYLAYLLYPLIAKSRIRGRLREAALVMGPRARIALAYASWRDFATDYGYNHPSDTPLMFCDRFPADDEHVELAWLVTRAMWGDLQSQVDDEMAANCEELARSLRRRLSAAHPATVRFISALSRLSTRDPYAPTLYAILQGTDDAVPAEPRTRRFRKKEVSDVTAPA